MVVCPNCKAQDNTFELQGVIFCSSCGRQIVAPPPPKTGGPKTDGEARDRLNKLRNSFTGLTGAPTSPGGKALQQDAAKKRRESLTQASAVSMAETGGGEAAKPGERMYQITKSKLEQIEKAVRKSCVEEMEVLEIELEQVRAEADALRKENGNLNKTLEEVMSECERGLDEAAKVRSDAAANLGIAEMEAAQLRQREEKLSADFKALYKEHTHMKSGWDALKASEQATLEKVSTLEAALAEAQKKFDALKDHAGKKLESAARVFSSVKQSDTEKDNRIKALESEVVTLKEKLSVSEAAQASALATVKQIRTECDGLNETLKEKTTKEAQLQKALTGTMSQMQQFKKEAEQTAEVAERYKVQVVELRETIRSKTVEMDAAQRAQQRAQAAVEQVKILEVQNTQLKSKLYESGGGGGGGGGAETQALLTQIKAKEQENRELMNMCDELLSQIEALKAGRRNTLT